MSEQTPDYPRRWVALAEDVTCGYTYDQRGRPRLSAVLVYEPTVVRLRGLRMADMAFPPDPAPSHLGEMPPSQAELIELWARTSGFDASIQHLNDVLRAGWLEEVEQTCAPGQLRRNAGEDPSAFYSRIALAHRALSHVTDTPTSELARRAEVTPALAGAWVSRARARGLYPTMPDGDES